MAAATLSHTHTHTQTQAQAIARKANTQGKWNSNTDNYLNSYGHTHARVCVVCVSVCMFVLCYLLVCCFLIIINYISTATGRAINQIERLLCLLSLPSFFKLTLLFFVVALYVSACNKVFLRLFFSCLLPFPAGTGRVGEIAYVTLCTMKRHTPYSWEFRL